MKADPSDTNGVLLLSYDMNNYYVSINKFLFNAYFNEKALLFFFNSHSRGIWSVSVSHRLGCGMDFPWLLIG